MGGALLREKSAPRVAAAGAARVDGAGTAVVRAPERVVGAAAEDDPGRDAAEGGGKKRGFISYLRTAGGGRESRAGSARGFERGRAGKASPTPPDEVRKC